jgi:hypothetical protein
MDESEKDALRRRLLTYPGIDAGNVEEHIWRYEERASQKVELLHRGFSNRLAEKWLDGSGYPRPPGWHSVFFYPGSAIPRIRYVVFSIALVALLIWLGGR